MIKYWCVSLVAVFCGLFARSEEESPFQQEPRIEIVCDQGVRADGYSRLATNVTAAGFNYVLVQDPIPKEEWEMSGPDESWNISPKLKAGTFESFGKRAHLKLRAADYGHSYTIELELTWTLTNKDTKEKVKESRSATYCLDAVFYWFMMFCSDGTMSETGLSLVDNHPAEVTVRAEGCSRPELVSLSFTSRPVANGTPINKMGTEMKFIRKSPLVFQVPKTFWYGLKKPQCCYTNQFPYEIVVREAHDGVVDVQTETVGMPRWEDAVAKMSAIPPKYTIKVDAEQGIYRVSVTMSEFERVIKVEGVEDVTNQYADEIKKEEEFHALQFKEDTSWEDGGEPDIYSAKEVRKEVLSKYKDDPIVFYSSEDEPLGSVSNRVADLIEKAIQDEIYVSRSVMDINYNYHELKAKIHAGYNAAWMYHCTYENAENPETNVVHKTRKEVEELVK